MVNEMCGRYLVDDEVYEDMWMLLHSQFPENTAIGGVAPLPAASGGVMPAASSGGGGMPAGAAVGGGMPVSPDEGASRPVSIAKGDIYPSNTAFVLTCDGAEAVRWGFPHWKNSSVIINARAETAAQKSMFKKPLLQRRCVVPSSGFYEWSRAGSGKKKDKFLLTVPGENVLYMAGMVSFFTDATGRAYSAFVILTTAANDSMSPIHDRMPVILSDCEREQWLSDDGFMERALRRLGPQLEATPA